jgi:5'-nucleotidase
MHFLLTNDDGVYAPGLAAMCAALRTIGEVTVVAPATEQSGVGHSITFLTPLMAKEVFVEPIGRVWAVEGSPADCVKLALAELCETPPHMVVSGINGGLNVGVNVLYSGTVAGATEGALNDLPSLAVSLEYEERPSFDLAAAKAVRLIEQLLDQGAWREHLLYNLNYSTRSLTSDQPVQVTSMGIIKWPAMFEGRRDPKGRRYFWATGNPPQEPPNSGTDQEVIRQGGSSLSPLVIDRTRHELLGKMKGWRLA